MCILATLVPKKTTKVLNPYRKAYFCVFVYFFDRKTNCPIYIFLCTKKDYAKKLNPDRGVFDR